MQRARLVCLLALAACGAADRDPEEALQGAWKTDTKRELQVEGDSLTWVTAGRRIAFPIAVTRKDPAARRVDVQVQGRGGVVYSIVFDEDYRSATLTEQTEQRVRHRLTRR